MSEFVVNGFGLSVSTDRFDSVASSKFLLVVAGVLCKDVVDLFGDSVISSLVP